MKDDIKVQKTNTKLSSIVDETSPADNLDPNNSDETAPLGAVDTDLTNKSTLQDKNPDASLSDNKAKTHRFWRWDLTKKQWGLVVGGIITLIAVASIGGYLIYQNIRKLPPQSSTTAKKIVLPSKQPTTEPSRLTGIPVTLALNKRPVTGVMIENSPDARPQSGLKDAGVVFEAIAEGGITRFLALFEEAQPSYIGPVRSARPYYLDWLLGFDASIAHVGGSPDALTQIKSLHIKDLDQFFNAGAYERVRTRFAPHNVYTSTAQLDALETAKGYTTSNFTGFPRKKESPSAKPTARSIDIALSSYLYASHYDYDSTTNSYKRSEGGKPHIDEKSGAQIAPKVVIAMIIPRGIASDGEHTNYATIGSGQTVVFQDGVIQTGTWQKTSLVSQITFSDVNGKPLKLNPGQTWITAVDSVSSVTYKP